MSGLEPLSIGDLVLTPDDRLATVVHLARDGQVCVETPWLAQWERFDPTDLTLAADESAAQ